jgi:hypothetical protein
VDGVPKKGEGVFVDHRERGCDRKNYGPMVLKKALAGTHVFVLDDPAHDGTGAAQTNVDVEPNLNRLQSVKPAGPPSDRRIPTKVSSLAPRTHAVAESSSNGAAGRKRNRERAPIDVIDLTDD